MIIFEKVSKNFNGLKALDELSFQINQGEIVGLLGPNGAGKTTTMRIMLGLLQPTQGKVTIDGINVLQEPLKVRKKVGYLPENNPLYEDFKVGEYLQFISEVKGLKTKTSFKETVQTCGLTSVLSKKIEHLSKGYQQRVGLAAALLGEPEILILDEPTVGLDPNQIIEIRNLIKNLSQQKTVILSSHILPEVQAVCQKLIIIHKGKVVAAGDLKKLTQGKSLEKIFQKLTLE